MEACVCALNSNESVEECVPLNWQVLHSQRVILHKIWFHFMAFYCVF